ncbi:MAG: hypothetical protein ABI067_06985 [Leifsonia sp.]
MIGSACKYFGWAEADVMNMTYEKFTMYLSTIPDYDTEADNAEGKSEENNITGAFNFFDFDQKLTL